MFRRLIACLVLTGTAVLPVVHQLDHSRPHSHGVADVLVFDASDQPSERGPHGGLLLHPKRESKPHHTHAPLSHGQGSVEHYAVAVALTAPHALTFEAVETPSAPFAAPVAVHVDTYLLSPLKAQAPPV